MLAAADWTLARVFPSLVAAVLVVALWKVATGGIHLDGLADCLDALGGGSRERRLAIMRDHRIGVFAAAGLACPSCSPSPPSPSSPRRCAPPR